MKNKWKDGADSPVLFFIDDLCNKWIDLNGDGRIQPEEDWGYAGYDKNGAMHYLENEILSANPEVKTTFFVPVGERVNIQRKTKYEFYSEAINFSSKSRDFYKRIHNNPKYELAYHGLTHGTPGNTAKDFMQEWESYRNISEAIDIIKKGGKIFKETVGIYPNGGKYCGYKSNHFSDDSIDKSDFKWWCRFYNKGLEDNNSNISGNDNNPLTAYDIKLFGENNVVDIPTTIPGSLATIGHTNSFIKNSLKKILKRYILKKKLKEIDFLLKNKLVISIQEHISPSRVDGKRQGPNIFDDKESLVTILKYLKNKNVWYCTGTELANWVKNRK